MAVTYNGKTADEWDLEASSLKFKYDSTGDPKYWDDYQEAKRNADNARNMGKNDNDSPSGGGSTVGGSSGETYSISNNYGSRTTLSGTSGDDSIFNMADYVTIEAGAGNDIVVNTGRLGYDVIYGGTGNDSIKNVAYFSTIFGGAGNDTLLGFENDTAMFVYNSGDGNDVIQSFDSSDTLSISGDNYSTTKSGSDLIVTVGTGKITLVGAGGTSPNIVGTYGTSTITPVTVAPDPTPTNDSVTPDIEYQRYLERQALYEREQQALYEYNNTTITPNPTPVTPIYGSNVYTGGDQVITNYTSGEQIILGTIPTGYIFSGGNFALSSATGNLFIANANDKVINFVDSAGNPVLKAYAATNPGILDGRGIAGYEYIVGSDAGTDVIYAGDGGSQLWGGAGIGADALVGGAGADMFIGGKYQGADTFMNASSADVVFLNDTTLSDIVAAGEMNGTIALAFNTGNVVAVQSSEALSAAFVLADGSAWRFNHATKSWQTA